MGLCKNILLALMVTILIFLLTYAYYEVHKNVTLAYLKEVNLNIVNFYGANLRGNLFSGFLALGGFIFSLKAFILVTMKQNVYDNDTYEKMWLKNNNNNRDGEAYFLPLKQLNELLYLTVLLAVFSAVANITVGLLSHIVFVCLCIHISVLALIYLIKSLFVIKGNLDIWFNYLGIEKFAEKKRDNF